MPATPQSASTWVNSPSADDSTRRAWARSTWKRRCNPSIVWSLASWRWMRPSMSYSRPSRRADFAAVEVTAAQPDTTHEQAFQIPGRVSLADDQFGAAAADVDHQHLLLGAGHMVRYAQINQPRLFNTGNDLDRVSQRGLRGLQKPPRAGCPPKRVGADDTHPACVHVLQPLAETLQAVDRAPGDRNFQPAPGIKPRCQPHHFPDPVDDRELPVPQPGYDHVETVGSQIHRGHDGRRFTRGRQVDDL